MLKTMLIPNVPNVEDFLKVVERSRGKVILHLPDTTQCDLKQDKIARQLLRVTKPGREGLCISLSDSKDAPAFLQYMMGVAWD